MFTEVLINYIRENYKIKSLEISDSIGLLNLALEELKDEIDKNVSKKLNLNEFDKVREDVEISELIKNKMEENDDLIEKLNIDDDIEKEIIKKEKDIERVDYELYKVDSTVGHTLYEDLTDKRPDSFTIEGENYKVTYWRDMLVEVALHLYKKDGAKFESFLEDKSMRGRKRKYFSRNIEEIDEAKEVGNSGIYIITLLSANSIKNLIIKMLRKYSLNISDVIVYFRADYSELNNKN